VAYRDGTLNWSIRHDLRRGPAHRVITDVADACRAICHEHLPPASGYELTCARLSGPLDGATITVARANFRALVSIQEFEAPAAANRHGLYQSKIRLVARATHLDVDYPGESREIALAQWGVSGCVAATMGAGAIALQAAGLLTAWGYALLLLPALVGTRAWMAVWAANQIRRRSLAPTRAEQAQLQARASAEARDMSRWAQALRGFEGQHDTIVARLQTRPFRGLSPGDPSESTPDAHILPHASSCT
jgi:hypothetical protein